MTRHLIDQPRTYRTNERLTQFLRILRGEFRHPTTEALLRRERTREPQLARIAAGEKARRDAET